MPRAKAEPAPVVASVHPFADLFPLMAGQEFDRLVADIRANGLREPIIEHDHAILDGRNRYNACIACGVHPRFVAYKGKDPLSFVISANLQRRHLNATQRAVIASKFANMTQGERTDRPSAGLPKVSQSDAASLFNVSTRSVVDAKKVRDEGDPRLVARIENGELAVSLAAKIAALPASVQREIADGDAGTLAGAVKRHAREVREQGLAAATQQASSTLGHKLYGVICADPPWRFQPRSVVTGMDRAADNHYPTMSLDDICAIKPPAAADCALFMWATAPMLLDCLDVIDAWGFEYKSQIVWVKDRLGTGYWVRSRHELLLIATRGSVPAPAPGEQFESVIDAAVGAHSEKPAHFYEMIEEMFPSAALLEMFARRARAGWDVFGNEVDASQPVIARAS